LINYVFNIFLSAGVLGHEILLDVHDGLDNQLQLIVLMLFFTCEDVVVFQDFRDGLVELHERLWKDGFYGWHLHDFTLFQVLD
jgi:hypothetical protein